MPNQNVPVTTIRPEKSWELLDLREFWATRALLVEFIVSDFRMRHRQTVIGIFWAILQPFLAVIVYSVLFGYFGKFPSEGVPYPIFLFSGYLVWMLFSRGLAASAQGLAATPSLISKVYVPRIHLIIAPISASAFEVVVSMGMLACLYVYYGILPSPKIILLPLFFALTIVTILACSFWLAPLNAIIRDVQIALPSALQLCFFLTPVVYPISLLPEWLRLWAYVNPMTAIVECCRWCLTSAPFPPLNGVAISASVVAILLVPGSMYFAAQTRVTADRI